MTIRLGYTLVVPWINLEKKLNSMTETYTYNNISTSPFLFYASSLSRRCLYFHSSTPPISHIAVVSRYLQSLVLVVSPPLASPLLRYTLQALSATNECQRIAFSYWLVLGMLDTKCEETFYINFQTSRTPSCHRLIDVYPSELVLLHHLDDEDEIVQACLGIACWQSHHTLWYHTKRRET